MSTLGRSKFPLQPCFPPLYSRPVQCFFMGKMKSHSGAKKRIRKTGSGKLAMKRRGRNHLLQQKSKRQKRLNRTLVLHSTNISNIEALVPHL